MIINFSLTATMIPTRDLVYQHNLIIYPFKKKIKIRSPKAKILSMI